MFENEIGRNPDTQHGPFDLGISRIAKSPCDWEIRVPYFQYMGGGGVDHDHITEENVKFNWATLQMPGYLFLLEISNAILISTEVIGSDKSDLSHGATSWCKESAIKISHDLFYKFCEV